MDNPAATGFGRTVKWPKEENPAHAQQHTVLCGGAVVLGPQPARLLITLCLLLVPFVLLAVFVLPRSPLPLVIVGVVCYAACLAFLFLTATRNPGVVEKRVEASPFNFPIFETVMITRGVGSDSPAGCCTGGGAVVEAESPMEHGGSSTNGAGGPLGRSASLSFEAKLKWCNSCQRYRAPRTFHCSLCDRCIDMYDHHCPWVGTCIGARNYAFFLWFLLSLQASLFVSVAACIATPYMEAERDGTSIRAALSDMKYMPCVLFAYIFLLGMPASVLTWFHVYLVSTGKLTIEHLRRTYSDASPNPFDEGCLRNWGRLFGRFDALNLADSFKDSFVAVVQRLVSRRSAREHAPMGASVDEGKAYGHENDRRPPPLAAHTMDTAGTGSRRQSDHSPAAAVGSHDPDEGQHRQHGWTGSHNHLGSSAPGPREDEGASPLVPMSSGDDGAHQQPPQQPVQREHTASPLPRDALYAAQHSHHPHAQSQEVSPESTHSTSREASRRAADATPPLGPRRPSPLVEPAIDMGPTPRSSIETLRSGGGSGRVARKADRGRAKHRSRTPGSRSVTPVEAHSTRGSMERLPGYIESPSPIAQQAHPARF